MRSRQFSTRIHQFTTRYNFYHSLMHYLIPLSQLQATPLWAGVKVSPLGPRVHTSSGHRAVLWRTPCLADWEMSTGGLVINVTYFTLLHLWYGITVCHAAHRTTLSSIWCVLLESPQSGHLQSFDKISWNKYHSASGKGHSRSKHLK